VVIDEVLAVGIGVGIEADGEDDDVGHAALEVDEVGELFDAGRAPAGPEVEDDGFASVIAEADGLRAVADDNVGGLLADLGGVAAAVAGKQAAGNRQQAAEKQNAEKQGTGYSVQGAEDGIRDRAAGEATPKNRWGGHVSIIRCSYRGRISADSLCRHSRSQ